MLQCLSNLTLLSNVIFMISFVESPSWGFLRIRWLQRCIRIFFFFWVLFDLHGLANYVCNRDVSFSHSSQDFLAKLNVQRLIFCRKWMILYHRPQRIIGPQNVDPATRDLERCADGRSIAWDRSFSVCEVRTAGESLRYRHSLRVLSIL